MKQAVFDFLRAQGIPYAVTEHEPVYTMEKMERLGLNKLGTICKNLFVRDAKGKRHFLITADDGTAVRLKELGEKLGAGKLSFASAERLQKYLGVTSGCVSPFGVLNDTRHEVTVVFDEKIARLDRIGVHPNQNDATVWLSAPALIDAVRGLGNEVVILAL